MVMQIVTFSIPVTTEHVACRSRVTFWMSIAGIDLLGVDFDWAYVCCACVFAFHDLTLRLVCMQFCLLLVIGTMLLVSFYNMMRRCKIRREQTPAGAFASFIIETLGTVKKNQAVSSRYHNGAPPSVPCVSAALASPGACGRCFKVLFCAPWFPIVFFFLKT